MSIYFKDSSNELPITSIDTLDRNIILELQEHARKHFKAIAKKLKVSEGTIKNRVNRLTNSSILKLEARVNPFAFPNRISAIVGVKLTDRYKEKIMRDIEKIPEVTSVYVVTGRYDLFFEVMVDSLSALDEVLHKKDLMRVNGISAMETFVIMASNTKYFKLS